MDFATAKKSRVVLIIRSEIHIGQYRDISTVSVISILIVLTYQLCIDEGIHTGHVIFASKDGGKE